MSTDANNKRAHTRVPVELKVSYLSRGDLCRDLVTDLSPGGLFIRTSKPLEIGTEFVFVLTVPEPSLDNAPVRLELTGEVKWVVHESQATEASPAGMGIQFVFENDAEKQRVERFVSELMTSSLGERLAKKLLTRP